MRDLATETEDSRGTAGNAGLKRYRRLGRARLVRTVTAPTSWATPSGQQLLAQPGDHILTDGKQYWSITDADFRATYRLAGDEYERIGTVLARLAIPGEEIISREGPQTAVPGDWLVIDQAGNTWLVSKSHFAQHYSLLT